MQINTKGLDPHAVKRLELIQELYFFVKEQEEEKNAFFDIKINEQDPKKSQIIANRPGIELFATELMMKTEWFFDHWEDFRNEIEPIEAGKWRRELTTVAFSEVEMIDIKRYDNSINHNSARENNNSFTNSIQAIGMFVFFILALFGAFSVVMFFVNR